MVTDSLGNAVSATITIGPALAISPSNTSSAPRGVIAFSASGGAGTYTFSLQTNASGAMIDGASGAYTAGATPGVADVVQVTDANGAIATAHVGVGAGITISPNDPNLGPRAARTFSASGGSGTGYVWSLTVNASGGTIDATTGAYTAGATTNVVDTIRVTDSLGNTATMNLSVGNGTAINPSAPSVAPRGAVNLTATGGSGTGYTWSITTNASGGRIDATTGAYTAGATGGVSDIITVTDSVGNSATVTAMVRPGLAISPPSSQVDVHATIAFSVTGGSGAGYVWSLTTNASGGSIDPVTGAYTAGPHGGSAVAHVTDSLGNGADATVDVKAPPAPDGGSGGTGGADGGTGTDAGQTGNHKASGGCGCWLAPTSGGNLLGIGAAALAALVAVLRRRRRNRR